MRSFYYILYNFVYKHFVKIYLKTDSKFTFDGFRLTVLKEVFHPKFFFSSRYFYSFLNAQPFQNRSFLEIGCGSGILSLLACRKGASVTAIDIDHKAVENTQLNFEKNRQPHWSFNVVQSDVFDNLPAQRFDVIAINPPYYFKKIETTNQYPWYCGENGEYFEKLFSGLAAHVYPGTCTYMILEENCEIDRIKTMAAKYAISFTLVDEKRIRWEKNYIFKLSVSGDN